MFCYCESQDVINGVIHQTEETRFLHH